MRAMPSGGSGEEERAEALAAGDRRRILDAPGLEELHELLPRSLVVPGAVAAHDLQELVGRAGAIALPVQHHCEIEARLVIVRVCLDPALEVGRRAELLGLRCKL